MSDRNELAEGAQDIAIAKVPENQEQEQDQERREALALNHKQKENLKRGIARVDEEGCVSANTASRTVKVFGIVALASVWVMVLTKLAFCCAPFFEWSWMPSVGCYIWLASDVGLCVAYVALLTSEVHDRFAIWGAVGCGLSLLTQLFSVLRPVISGWQWLHWMFALFGLTGIILVAISILRFPRDIHPGAKVVGLIGIGYNVLLELAWLILGVVAVTTSSSTAQFWEILNLLSGWPDAIAYTLFAIPFVALFLSNRTGPYVGIATMCARIVEHRRISLVEVFAYSVFGLGLVAFIFNLICGSPSADSGLWSSEKRWDCGFIVTAFSTLFANTLLGFFILSQIKVRNCFESLKVKIVSSGPICLVIVQVVLYIVLVVCVISLIWAMCADDYDFRRALEGGFISSMSLGMFRQLSRIREVINLRVYFTIVMVVEAWYSVGLAKLMALIGLNSAVAYSLSGIKQK